MKYCILLISSVIMFVSCKKEKDEQRIACTVFTSNCSFESYDFEPTDSSKVNYSTDTVVPGKLYEGSFTRSNITKDEVLKIVDSLKQTTVTNYFKTFKFGVDSVTGQARYFRMTSASTTYQDCK